jgi:hypothetical protein
VAFFACGRSKQAWPPQKLERHLPDLVLFCSVAI